MKRWSSLCFFVKVFCFGEQSLSARQVEMWFLGPPCALKEPSLGLCLVQVIQDRLVNTGTAYSWLLVSGTGHKRPLWGGKDPLLICGRCLLTACLPCRCMCWRGRTWTSSCAAWESCLNVCCLQPASLRYLYRSRIIFIHNGLFNGWSYRRWSFPFRPQAALRLCWWLLILLRGVASFPSLTEGVDSSYVL